MTSLRRAADEELLKVHHFLPAGSYASALFIQPWCERVAKESNKKT